MAGELGRTVGRVVLWVVVGVVLVRGLGSTFGGRSDTAPAARVATATGVLGGSDLEARAFAERFASAYLTVMPKRPTGRQRQVGSFLAQGLGDQAAAVLPSHGSGMSVALATVAREVPLSDSRALFTVATTSTTGLVRYLTIPVARDRTGALTVDGLPSLAPPPGKSTAAVSQPPALSGPDAGPIRDLVGRFLSAYLAGQGASTLRYFLAPGTRLVQMPSGLKVLSVGQVSRDPHPAGRIAGLAVVVAVRVKDQLSGATYPLSYRLRVLRRERWYVSAVVGGPVA